MDIRIVNTCNSDCLYCLEHGLRRRKKFIPSGDVFKILETAKDREVLSFYGGNPLLHPELLDIIRYAKSIGYKNISLLTNTCGLNKDIAKTLQGAGLNAIQFYFHNFKVEKHTLMANGGISLQELMKNIQLIQSMGFATKAIIHINAQNVETVYRDIQALHKHFLISSFELVDYKSVSRAYKKYDKILRYDKSKLQLIDIQKFVYHIGGQIRFEQLSK